MKLRAFAISAFLFFTTKSASAQQGYEFEVYDTDIGRKGSTELELSSNYVARGLTEDSEGLYATHHASRSSLEISRTLVAWLQGTAYVTANARPSHALSYVGNRIKLTAVAPSGWRMPFDVGLANELVYSRPGFAEDRWAYELTPILAKTVGPVAFVFNPAFERGLSGSGVHHIEMEPKGKVGYTFGDDAAIALEYYASLGGIGEGYTLAEQRHQLFGKIEGEMSPQLEGSFALGRGLTRSSDKWVLAVAVEYRFGR
jgi:hypothetical protein